MNMAAAGRLTAAIRNRGQAALEEPGPLRSCGRRLDSGTANWTSAAESHAAAAVIVRVPQGIPKRDPFTGVQKTLPA
jgi:hypothetical protein